MKLRTILFVLALLAFLSASSGGYLYYSSLRRSAFKEADRQALSEAKAIKNRISSFLSENQKAVKALAGLDDLEEVLLGGDERSLAKANAILDHFHDALEVSVCYLMDREGNTLVSSNRYDSDSFVGKNYAFRPYFQQALQGTPAVYMALGVTSKRRGIYYSHPVYERGRSGPIGVVVIKASIASLEKELNHAERGIALLTDLHGVIFVSNRQDWLYRVLWKVSPHEITEIAESRQFGKGPWKWTGIEHRGDNLAIAEGGDEYLIHQMPIENCAGWNSVYLVSLRAISQSFFDPLIRSSGFIVLSLCILIGFAVFFLYRTASHDIARRRMTEKALRESEERFRAITGTAADAIILMDNQGKISYWNPAAERIFGYSTEEAIGKELHLLIAHPEYHEAFMTGFAIFKQTGHGPVIGKTAEFKAVKKNGIEFPIEVSTSAINIGGEWHATGIIRDVTQRKEAEKSLRESEEKYRNILESIEEGYFEVDIAGNFIFFNDALCEISGYARDELMGMNNRDYTSPETAKKMFRVFNEIYRSGKPATIVDYKIFRKDGGTRILELSASLVHDSTGQAIGFRGVARDVTERKIAEGALRESEEKYRTVLETNPDPVVVYDIEGKVVYFNPAFTRVFGWTLEERLGKKMDMFVPEENWRETKMMIEKVLAGESFSGIASHRYTRGGDVIPVSISGTIYRDREGNPVGSVINIRDISEEKNLQGQLQQAQKMEAVGTLAGGIAHDFNNLLQTIQGYAELMLRGKAREAPGYRGLWNIVRAAKRGGELTRQLLTFSRKVESKRRPLDVNHEVREVKSLLARTLPRMIDIQVHLADDLRIVSADPVQMEQVLMNLAVNAKDAMPDGGKIIIETENVTLDAEFSKTHLGAKYGDYVVMRISDTGHGMDTETLQHIFEPFYTTKGPGMGTGLGLAMVYGIVKDHDGYIMCSSEPGVGTTFNIYLPVIEEQEEIAAEQATEAPIQSGSETILLVDDEEFIRDVGVELLGDSGYTVITAADGENALRLYREEQGRIDLVILDLIMPGMGGKKCLEEFFKINPDARILIASGYSASGPVEEAMKTGARGYICKPYEIDHMLKTVREVLDHR